ncbi:MAG: response regulator [Vicinamibacteria bacterium]
MERAKVLVVDDSRLILRIAKAFLEDRYDVITAETGLDALRKAIEERPDVMLTDMNMPGMSGEQVRQALACDPRTRGIRVVITTTDTAASGLAPGVDLLLKPYDASSLRAKIGARVH